MTSLPSRRGRGSSGSAGGLRAVVRAERRCSGWLALAYNARFCRDQVQRVAEEAVAANDAFGEMRARMVELAGLMWWG